MKHPTLNKTANIGLVISALLLCMLGFFASIFLYQMPLWKAILHFIIPLLVAGFFVLLRTRLSIMSLIRRESRAAALALALYVFLILCTGNCKGLMLPLVYLLAAALCVADTSDNRRLCTLLALTIAAQLAAALLNSVSVIFLLSAASVYLYIRVRKELSLSSRIFCVVLLAMLPLHTFGLNSEVYQAFDAIGNLFYDLTDAVWHDVDCSRADILSLWAGDPASAGLLSTIESGRILTVIAYHWGAVFGVIGIALMLAFCGCLVCKRIASKGSSVYVLSGLACIVFLFAYPVYILLNCGVINFFCLKDSFPPLLGTDILVNTASLLLVAVLLFSDPLQLRVEPFDSLFPAAPENVYQIKTLPFFGADGHSYTLAQQLRSTFQADDNAVTLISTERNYISLFSDYETVCLVRYEGSAEGACSFRQTVACSNTMLVKLIAHPNADVLDLFEICNQLKTDNAQQLICLAGYDESIDEDVIRLYAAILSDNIFDALPESADSAESP